MKELLLTLLLKRLLLVLLLTPVVLALLLLASIPSYLPPVVESRLRGLGPAPPPGGLDGASSWMSNLFEMG